jgi:hypothetical protein
MPGLVSSFNDSNNLPKMDLSIRRLNFAGTTQQNPLVLAKVTTFLIFPDVLMKALNYWKLGQTVSNGEVEVFMANPMVANRLHLLNESPNAARNSHIHYRLYYKSHKEA